MASILIEINFEDLMNIINFIIPLFLFKKFK